MAVHVLDKMSSGKLHTSNDAKRRGVDRQISFSVVSSSDTPLRPLTPSVTAAGWTAELEERLRYVQSQMEAHQRRWSAGQEDYLEEVRSSSSSIFGHGPQNLCSVGDPLSVMSARSKRCWR